MRSPHSSSTAVNRAAGVAVIVRARWSAGEGAVAMTPFASNARSSLAVFWYEVPSARATTEVDGTGCGSVSMTASVSHCLSVRPSSRASYSRSGEDRVAVNAHAPVIQLVTFFAFPVTW